MFAKHGQKWPCAKWLNKCFCFCSSRAAATRSSITPEYVCRACFEYVRNFCPAARPAEKPKCSGGQGFPAGLSRLGTPATQTFGSQIRVRAGDTNFQWGKLGLRVGRNRPGTSPRKLLEIGPNLAKFPKNRPNSCMKRTKSPKLAKLAGELTKFAENFPEAPSPPKNWPRSCQTWPISPNKCQNSANIDNFAEGGRNRPGQVRRT